MAQYRVMLQMPYTPGIASVFDKHPEIEVVQFTETSEANILQHVGEYDAAILGVARFGAVAQCRRTPMRSEAVSDQEEFAEEDAAAAADAAAAFSFGSSARRSSSGTPISRCLRVAIERATSCAPSTHSATD